MKKIGWILLILGVLCFAGAATLLAEDTVTMRDGAFYKGRVSSVDRAADQVVMEVPGSGVKVLKFQDVKTILISGEMRHPGMHPPFPPPPPKPKVEPPAPPLPANAKLVLEDDASIYQWVEPTEVQTKEIRKGKAAFRSTGNNHFLARLGVVGDYTGLYRDLDFWIYLQNPQADIQIQVQVDGQWGKRWGYDAEPNYNGYSWPMEGTTGSVPYGQWVHQRLDLKKDLHINPGQTITGLAFSSDNGDVYYDAVYLLPDSTPATKPAFHPTGKDVLEDNANLYSWVDAPETQDYLVFFGSKAFRSNGNDHFLADLGQVGYAMPQSRYLTFWAFFMGPQADLQLQVQVNGQWGKRWGFDAEPVYNGYSWPMEGTTGNMPSGKWVKIELDLINQLHINPGQSITGLAFSSDNGDVIFDSVYLRR